MLYWPLCPQNLTSSEGHLPALLFLEALAALAEGEILLPQGAPSVPVRSEVSKCPPVW